MKPSAICLALGLTLHAPTAWAEEPASEPASESESAPDAHEAFDGYEPDPLMEEPVVEDGISFKPGRGLIVRSKDGSHALGIGMRMQLRASTRLSKDGTGGTDATTELTVRRARVSLFGHLFGENNTYTVQLSFSPRDNGVGDSDRLSPEPFTPMRDFYMTFTHVRDLNVRVGQFKVPYSRERVVSSGNQQLVERSIANAEFNLDRSVGLSLRSPDLFGLGFLRYQAGVFSVQGRGAVGFDAPHFAYVARLEVLPLGLFETLLDADIERGATPRLNIAVAVAYEDEAPGMRGNRGPRPADGGTTDITSATADLLLLWRGISVTTDAYLRSGVRRTGPVPPAEPARNGWGGRAQLGYVVPVVPLEVVARYAILRGDRSGATSLIDEDEIGVGVNLYVAAHALKLQTDYMVGLRDDRDDPVHGVRMQVQGRL